MPLLFCLTGNTLGTTLMICTYSNTAPCKPHTSNFPPQQRNNCPNLLIFCAGVFLRKITCVFLAYDSSFGTDIRITIITKQPIHVPLIECSLCDFPINLKLQHCPYVCLFTIGSSHFLHKGSKLSLRYGQKIPTPSNFIRGLDNFSVLFWPFLFRYGVHRDLLL